MYLSHPVRRVRDDPDPDAEIGLVVELDAADGATLRRVVADAGGEVLEALRFDAYHVVVPETAVDDLCALDGIARIETDMTLGHGF